MIHPRRYHIDYDDIEYEMDTTYEREEYKQNNKQLLQLKLCASIPNSIPLKTIEVTTPNNTHTTKLVSNTKSKISQEILPPIVDIMNDDLNGYNNNNNKPLETIQSIDCYSDDNKVIEEKQSKHRNMPSLTRKNSQKKADKITK